MKIKKSSWQAISCYKFVRKVCPTTTTTTTKYSSRSLQNRMQNATAQLLFIVINYNINIIAIIILIIIASITVRKTDLYNYNKRNNVYIFTTFTECETMERFGPSIYYLPTLSQSNNLITTWCVKIWHDGACCPALRVQHGRHVFSIIAASCKGPLTIWKTILKWQPSEQVSHWNNIIINSQRIQEDWGLFNWFFFIDILNSNNNKINIYLFILRFFHSHF